MLSQMGEISMTGPHDMRIFRYGLSVTETRKKEFGILHPVFVVWAEHDKGTWSAHGFSPHEALQILEAMIGTDIGVDFVLRPAMEG